MIPSIIRSIITGRKRLYATPCHALLSEVLAKAKEYGMGKEEVMNALKELRRGGMIEAGHTLNDIWIKFKK